MFRYKISRYLMIAGVAIIVVLLVCAGILEAGGCVWGASVATTCAYIHDFAGAIAARVLIVSMFTMAPVAALFLVVAGLALEIALRINPR